MKSKKAVRDGTHELKSTFSHPCPVHRVFLPVSSSVVVPHLQTQHLPPSGKSLLVVKPLTG